MRALSLVEAAGFPVMKSINTYAGHIDVFGVPYLPLVTSSEQLFHSWLTRGGKLPPTWRSLLQVICQLGLDDLVNQIEAYLGTGRAKHDPKGAQRREEKTVMAVEGERIGLFTNIY